MAYRNLRSPCGGNLERGLLSYDLACWVLEGLLLIYYREVWSAHRKTKGVLDHAPSSTPMFAPLSKQRILSSPFASVPTVLLRIAVTWMRTQSKCPADLVDCPKGD